MAIIAVGDWTTGIIQEWDEPIDILAIDSSNKLGKPIRYFMRRSEQAYLIYPHHERHESGARLFSIEREVDSTAWHMLMLLFVV